MSYVVNLRVFVRIYELGSISAAGRDLRLSSAVASSRLADLETHLGARLFNRTTRKLNATEQGHQFYIGAIKVLEAIANAESSVTDITGEPRGSLLVAANRWLVSQYLAKLIPAFQQHYPHVQVRLRQTDRNLNIVEEGIDLAFMMTQLQDSNLRVRVLASCARGLFAAPSYLARHGTPLEPGELTGDQHNCLLLRFPGAQEFRWHLRDGDTVKAHTVTGTLEADDADVLTGWALQGHGIVLKTDFEVAEHVKTGALVRILPQTPPTSIDLACLFPEKRLQDPKARLFMEFACNAIKAELKTADDQLPR